MSAAVPEALSFAPGLVPALSRWAMTTIVSGELPGTTVERFSSRTRPRPGIVASKRSTCVRKPYAWSCCSNHWTAPVAPGDPGERSGNERARSVASAVAALRSKAGGSGGAGSGVGRATLNAATRSGSPTSSHVPRYIRALTGRSSEPGRGRRYCDRAGAAAIAGYSRRRVRKRAGRQLPMPDASTILLVDDEDSIQKLLTYPLEREGFCVVAARDGEEALERFATEPFDLVVLDVMLPKLDGLEVCRRLRSQSSVPIIMLTARDDELDKVLGLELGADDYITKPFSIREFRSRVRALLRRASAPRPDAERSLITAGKLSIDLARRTVAVDGRNVQLTYVEFELLRTLASNPGIVFSRQRLLEALWGGSDYREPRTIDVHVRHLREKLERDPREPEFILTVRGVGYRFRDR